MDMLQDKIINMAYITDLSDWAGSFLESIDNLYLSVTPSIMLLLGVISIMSIMTIFYMWIKQQAKEVV
jgi:hypothetical protein